MRVIASFTLTLLALIVLTAAPVHAETIYSYVGDPFGIVTGTYTMADRITGSLTIRDGFIPPPGAFSSWREGVLAWSFTDGHQMLTNENSQLDSHVTFGAATEQPPKGWIVELSSPSGSIQVIKIGDFLVRGQTADGSGLSCSLCVQQPGDSVLHGPGTWTVQTVITLGSSGHDTYVRSGAPNTNEGASAFLRLAASGRNRALVRFDQARLVDLVADRTVASVILRMNIVDNGDNWSTAGRTVDIHRMTVDWAEGNGRDSDYNRSESFRGDEPGATWNCAIDSDTTNSRANCSDATEWEMSRPRRPDLHPWVFDPTATVLITDGLTGQVEFDVTADVQAFIAGTAPNYGWIIKKTDEGQPGRVDFASRESGHGAILLITYGP